ncbi:hypothetical protein [Actinokineospora sp. NBRC 105648]|uniref:DUF6414 family protein n=1 Tax=Actinokineospora sp. NBRC 105648 TaxID=3032206 RepID=UPI0024A173AA|nr:hypothetical protein [Actinokineospora sp. NBRC 105648]GLZ42444.1 hypothetical protein Acsp05_60680 [Actinokineospora sp. NBRC 105648]
MSILRDFVYYDSATIDSFMSSFEGGLYDEEDRHTTASSMGVGAGDETDVSSSDSWRKTLRQTPAGRFSRLYEYIQKSAGLLEFRQGEALQLDAIEEDQFCLIRGTIEISQVVSAVMNAPQYQAISNVVKQFGKFGLIDDLAEVEKVDEQLAALTEVRHALNDKISVVLSVGSAAPKFALPIRRSVIGERFNELEGRATVFGRFSEAVPRSKRYTLIDLPGRPPLSRQQRRQAAKTGQADQASVGGPLAILNVIAVYR